MVTIKYEMHKLGLSVMVNVRVQISTGQYVYPISIADQGSDAANEAQAKRELRKILQGVFKLLGSSEEADNFTFNVWRVRRTVGSNVIGPQKRAFFRSLFLEWTKLPAAPRWLSRCRRAQMRSPRACHRPGPPDLAPCI